MPPPHMFVHDFRDDHRNNIQLRGFHAASAHGASELTSYGKKSFSRPLSIFRLEPVALLPQLSFLIVIAIS
jgi:hypothetical protein